MAEWTELNAENWDSNWTKNVPHQASTRWKCSLKDDAFGHFSTMATDIFASCLSLLHFLPRYGVHKWVLGILETDDIECGNSVFVEGLVNWYQGWKGEEGRGRGGGFVLQCCDQSSTPVLCYDVQQNLDPSTPSNGLKWNWGGLGGERWLILDWMRWNVRFSVCPISCCKLYSATKRNRL